MMKLVWANVVHRASRLLLPGLAVALGVAFVAGTLMVTDTMRAALLDQLTRTSATLDVVVERQPQDVAGSARTVPAALLDEVATVDGVAAAHGQVWGPVKAARPDGRTLTAAPSRTQLIGIADESQLWDVRFVRGQAPAGPTDIAIDRDTANEQRIGIGDQLLLTAGSGARPQPYTVTGLMDVDTRRDDLGDGVVVGTTDAVAVQLLRATAFGRIETVAASGLSQEALRDRLIAQLGDRYAVRTGAAVRAQEARDAARDLDGFSNALLVFAGITTIVAGVVAYNTFSVLLAQRLRETALLRCVGATRRQVRVGALGESALLGFLASVVGLVLGLAAARVLLRVFGSGEGIDVGGATPLLEPRTALVAFVLGPVVAMLAAVGPTLKASRIRPVEALRDAAPPPVRSAGRRRRTATVLASLAAVLVVGGVVAARTLAQPGRLPIAAVVVGALALITAVLIFAPLAIPRLGSAASRILGRILGHPGRLAGENARRNPERTATTAAALCIGLTLVTVVSTIAAAATRSIEEDFAQNFPFAYTLRVDSATPTASTDVMAALEGRPEVGAVVGARGPSSATEVIVNGRAIRMKGVDDTVARAAPTAVAEGSLRGFGPGKVALEAKLARQLRVEVGDRLTARSANGTELTLSVVALLDAMSPLGPFAVSGNDLTRVAPALPVSAVYVTQASGATDAAFRRAVTDVVAGQPAITPVSSAQSIKQWTEAMSTLRGLLLSLLGLSVLIAFFSVANTLSLSIVERTRESGLLRALGLTRRQLSRTLMAEGFFVVTLGAAAGIVLGVGLGWAVAAAMNWSLTAVLSFPAAQIALFAVLALVVGLLATALPARRAGRSPITLMLARE
ncbi:ABC transporter permease [Micromonospora sp. DT43]|uniref:ABC transporter permease n=1 Tax=Micromonospora sp. DT43 TaxID=3393440 RepID=UPI003CFAA6DB